MAFAMTSRPRVLTEKGSSRGHSNGGRHAAGGCRRPPRAISGGCHESALSGGGSATPPHIVFGPAANVMLRRQLAEAEGEFYLCLPTRFQSGVCLKLCLKLRAANRERELGGSRHVNDFTYRCGQVVDELGGLWSSCPCPLQQRADLHMR